MRTSISQKRLFAQSPLPLFLTLENKYLVGVFLYGSAIAMYLPANHFHIFPPQFLPMSWVDTLTPFLPNTVWIYLSEYIFFAAAYIVCNDTFRLNQYFYSYMMLQVVSVFIFVVWPTTYPRDLFPLPPDLNALTAHFFSNLRVLDSPANCCPSLHVSSVYLTTFLFLDDEKKGRFPFFFVWGTAIAISTLTTKQHYLVDVVVGFLMASLFYFIFHKYVNYRPLKSGRRHAKR